MPITKTTGYLASDGVVYASIEQAQTAELRKLLETVDGCGMFPTQSIDQALDRVAADLLNHRDDLLDILASSPRSRPRRVGAPLNNANSRINVPDLLAMLESSYGLTQEQVKERLSDRSLLRIKKIGPKRFKALQDWAAASQGQVKEGIQAMRDAANGGTNATHDADIAAEPAAA